jgi:ACS family D-galactonate transporter-like MFS transporter
MTGTTGTTGGAGGAGGAGEAETAAIGGAGRAGAANGVEGTNGLDGADGANRTDPAVIATRATGVRYGMLVLIFVGTALNFVDRANLSVAAPTLAKALALSPVQLGFLFSAYAWSYLAFNLPAGVAVDRWGTRGFYAIAIAVWSALTMCQGLATRMSTLVLLRLGVGVAEAPTFPVNNRVVSVWFPRQQRGLATSTYLVGQYIGMAMLTPLLYWGLVHFGWASIFYATGAIGLIWAAVWWAAYRDPHRSSRVNAAELALLEEGEALSAQSEHRLRWADIAWLFGNRQIVAICIGKFAVLSALYFFLTWFPTYLTAARHLSASRAGSLGALPFIAASVGVLFGGYLSDWLIKLGVSVGAARKTPLIAGLLLVPSMTFATTADSDSVALAIMSFAFFAQGVASCSWSMIADIAPVGMVGVTGGAVNFVGNLSGIVTPIAIGYIVRETGGFEWALRMVSAFALIGAACYIFVLGDLHRIVTPKPSTL